VSRIVLVAGTYEFDDDMCSNEGGSALCIDRNVTIEAEVSGSVVLNAKGARRVIYVFAAVRAELVGLNITGGKADYVLEGSHRRLQGGGGVYVGSNGVAHFKGCNIHDNTADEVCLHLELSLNFHPPPLWSLTSLSRLEGRWWRLCRIQRSG
jgi:hypothetical protein